ncbi:hypothetical protein GCM10023115_20600 [Pontixanthobacter gangjinensis]|uniref:Uncharacterized protein n=1 Tax=Pontixanthobacter gangjinensis TaxID=1028742 RepID=A0A6I4SR11_9SPHN|nr:hypothetical protein [Pontixanthobacter gangjinensis]MXO57307.1 hypothetical protein [Pontixanthobacter gangjinensis]
MKSILKLISVAAGTASLALSTPALAQMQPWADYTPQETVVELTYVKVDEGQLGFYLEGLKGTWVKANEIAKELGQITDYGIYVVPFGSNEVNLVLRVNYPNMAELDPSKAKYDQFMQAWGNANMESSNKTVRELYNNIREIKGTYVLREIKMNSDD